MDPILKTFGTIAIGIAFCSVAQAKAWRGITPLRSTRADVERLLGKPGVHGRYRFNNERADIYYAEGSCDKKDCECLIPVDTVLNISVTLETEMRFSKLRIDRSKYKKTYASNDPNLAVYANDEEGIIYDVSESNDDVLHIWYTPSARDCDEVVTKHSHNRRARITRAWSGLAMSGASWISCVGEPLKRSVKCYTCVNGFSE